ncbi:3-oxo-tetronate kinase [Youngiibacter multivorans]|uniref:3-oxo-tetronate kinase n=1 Tax=Youngiibacter multivorans TaxID=937251 RepID=UPI001AEB1B9A|nr:3-oxo-tetronate kinase [Youngiibacter multivorans]
MNQLLLGCIADDFTGASDLASFLANEGIGTLLFNGIPSEDDNLGSADAIVIALKTRTIEKSEAVAQSLAALDWLRKSNAEKIYIKYCSTFDSTREGNIGPVVDAVIQSLGVEFTLLCPSLPANGRTVKDGHLYVNGIPLHESSMKDHPLTPMWDSDLRNLMGAQSRYKSYVLTANDLKRSKDEILAKVMEHGKGQEHFYIIPDFEDSLQGEKIIDTFLGLPVLTGGSGLMEPLGKALLSRKCTISQTPKSKTDGAAIILAGSCSVATLAQIDNFLVCNRGPSLKLDPIKVLEGKMGSDDVIEFIRENQGRDILVYSSEPIEKVRKAQAAGAGEISDKLEALMSIAAEEALLHGYGRIIVAGGETSGAVTKRLGFTSYRIGESVAPGVPVMVPEERPDIRLILKSGNFGKETFFAKALEMTGGNING